MNTQVHRRAAHGGDRCRAPARLFAFAMAMLAIVLVPARAGAQTCTFLITDADFGSVDMTTGADYTTTLTVTVTCFGQAGRTIILCPNINAGSGGVATGGDPRYMRNGSSSLGYNLYWSGNPLVWGSYDWPHPPRPPVYGITLSKLWWWGYARGTFTIDARLPGGQTTVPPGSYLSSFTGHTRFEYGYYGSGVWCGSIPNARVATPSFDVRANVVPNCLVTATDIDFGNAGVLSSSVDATGSITVRCNAGVSYQIALDGGTAGATDPTAREMRNGPYRVRYGIYRDAARTQPWGNTLGVDTVSATATGLDQVYTTYGRVPPQPTPPVGTYTDTVVVTVTY
jgi:spore coat protein U-like protein